MNEQRSYKRPPVVEAAIELRYSSPISQAVLERAAVRLSNDYPIAETEQNHSVTINPGDKSAVLSFAWAGAKRSSNDRTNVVMFRTGSTIVGHLAPYRGWPHVIDRTEAAWAALSRASGENIALARIGVRYINRLDVPIVRGEEINAHDYVKFYPDIPSETRPDSDVQEYYTRIVFRLGDKCSVGLVSATASAALVGHKSFVLDIDVYRERDIPRKTEDIWLLLDAMRSYKNGVFESCITDKARGLFNL